MRSSSRSIIAALATTVFFSFAVAPAGSTGYWGCTGQTKDGKGNITTADGAPYGNFGLHEAGWVSAPGYAFPKYSVVDYTLHIPDPKKVERDGTVYVAQTGMVMEAQSCEWDRTPETFIETKKVPNWNGQCDRTTLTIVCHYGNSSSMKDCKANKAEWEAKTPLAANQKWIGGWIQTCLSKGEPPVSNPVDVTDTNVNVKIDKPSLPAYKRDGSALSKSHDDFSGKYK